MRILLVPVSGGSRSTGTSQFPLDAEDLFSSDDDAASNDGGTTAPRQYRAPNDNDDDDDDGKF